MKPQGTAERENHTVDKSRFSGPCKGMTAVPRGLWKGMFSLPCDLARLGSSEASLPWLCSEEERKQVTELPSQLNARHARAPLRLWGTLIASPAPLSALPLGLWLGGSGSWKESLPGSWRYCPAGPLPHPPPSQNTKAGPTLVSSLPSLLPSPLARLSLDQLTETQKYLV